MNTTVENDNRIVTEDHFVLAIRNWDDQLEDYLPVDDPSTVTQAYNEFADAETDYFSKKYNECPQAGGKDIKVELLHMRFGIPHIVRNRILFP